MLLRMGLGFSVSDFDANENIDDDNGQYSCQLMGLIKDFDVATILIFRCSSTNELISSELQVPFESSVRPLLFEVKFDARIEYDWSQNYQALQ